MPSIAAKPILGNFVFIFLSVTKSYEIRNDEDADKYKCIAVIDDFDLHERIIPVIWSIDVYEKAKPMVKWKILLVGLNTVLVAQYCNQ